MLVNTERAEVKNRRHFLAQHLAERPYTSESLDRGGRPRSHLDVRADSQWKSVIGGKPPSERSYTLVFSKLYINELCFEEVLEKQKTNELMHQR